MSADYKPGEMPPRPEEFRNWAPSPYCPHFIEKLLLAIIDAHPLPADAVVAKNAEHERQVRLSKAIEALLGVKRPMGRKSDFDLPHLMLIAREHIFFDFGRRYEEELINPPAQLTEVEAFQSVMKRIAGKTAWDPDLNAEYVRLRDKYNDEVFREYAMQALEPDLDDHDEEVAILSDLRKIAKVLARWSVRTQNDPTKLGLMSLTNERAIDPFDERKANEV